jgi:hypothetical protein
METNNKTILMASYPLQDSKEVLKIAVFAPINEPLPGKQELIETLEISESEAEQWLADIQASEATQASRRVYWTMSAPEYVSEKKYSVGIDDMQAMLLAMQAIAQEIRDWEQESCMKCEFNFADDVKIIYSPAWEDEEEKELA